MSRRVNRNVARIEGTLRAIGSVDGHFTDADGRRRTFHAAATLFYLPCEPEREAGPYLRFDLEKLGDTQLLVGSNADRYWYFSKEEGHYQCGRHDEDEEPATIPFRPRELVEGLGLTRIPLGPAAQSEAAPVHRIERDYQQILFIESASGSGPTLRKEYWVDRYAPRLVGRVLFRDPDGSVVMASSLHEYSRLGADGPWLPHLMVADWPDAGVHLRFQIRRWRVFPQVNRQSIQFATPPECAWEGEPPGEPPAPAGGAT